MELRPWEYRDPGQVLTDVIADHPLSEGDMLLVLVHDPSGAQQVLKTIPFEREDQNRLDSHEGGRILAGYLDRLAVPLRRPGKPTNHSVMTISARCGLALIGPAEAACLTAWRYSNHFVDTAVGELMVVTEHGWADFMSGWGGREPRLPLPEDRSLLS